MENEMELQQIIYKTLAVQIEFGVYRFEEQLPTIEEASQLFLVSTDTVRSAYLLYHPFQKRGRIGEGLL